MNPGSSSLLPKESENAVVDVSDVNANSVGSRSQSGNDT